MSLPGRWTGRMLLVCCVLLTVRPAWGVIVRARPLGDFIAESQFLFTAKVEKLNAEQPSAMLTVEDELKGKLPFRQLSIDLTGDSDAKQRNHTPQLLKRLSPGLPLVLFAAAKDDKYLAFAYTNGTWFQLRGTTEDDTVRWKFLHCEPLLHGTYKGTTAELKQLIADVLAGKAKPPPPDLKDKGALGPEVEADREQASISLADTGIPFAVIPSVLIGGPLAILALLFPVACGSLLLVLRRWTAALTVASINSTLYVLYDWPRVRAALGETWPGSASALWLLMSLVTLAGLFWAWRRHLTAVRFVDYIASRKSEKGATSGEPEGLALSLAERPRRGEGLILGALGLLLLSALLYWISRGGSLLLMPWKGLVVLTAGAGLGAIYTPASRLRAVNGAALPLEGVVLGAMLVAGLVLSGGSPRTILAEDVQTGSMIAREGWLAGKVKRTDGGWRFTAPGKGTCCSSPLVAGGRVYLGAAFTSVFQGDYGAVYCLDRVTGSRLWAFNEDNTRRMKPVFSSPCLADGRLYIGEGFHQDTGCKFYCLHAATGEPIWTFATHSHTESSPCVAGGKVYFGAGDDGLYCLDAATGSRQWQYQKEIHMDASPVVVGGRLYCGGGVVGEAAHHDAGIFCLDAATRREIWFEKMDLPALAAPAAVGDAVFFALGNGNFSVSDASNPAGAVVAVEAATGKQLWRFDAPDAILTRPAVDDASVYFGSRDGHCYCVARASGQLRWKRPLGSPVVASPALAACSECGASAGLYVLGTEGLVCCLDPATGAVLWRENVVEKRGNTSQVQLFSSPSVTVTRTGEGDRRRVYFGAGMDRDLGTTPVVFCFEDVLSKAD